LCCSSKQADPGDMSEHGQSKRFDLNSCIHTSNCRVKARVIQCPTPDPPPPNSIPGPLLATSHAEVWQMHVGCCVNPLPHQQSVLSFTLGGSPTPNPPRGPRLRCRSSSDKAVVHIHKLARASRLLRSTPASSTLYDCNTLTFTVTLSHLIM
jgi:hypothetical protein